MKTKIQAIPLVDLHAQYLSIKDEIDDAIFRVIQDSAFVKGKYVREFEEHFSRMMGTKNCVSCGNGTDALYIIMKSLGLGPGDEVITTAHSWIATSETISQTGAKVVFADTTEDTFTLDAQQLENKITSRTKGIIPVHLYGQMADMDPIMQLARKHHLWVIEDCAQAHLAEYKGKKAGTIGTAAAFSFYPGKNLGAMGDAGCIITNDDDLAIRCRRFAGHGALSKHDHEIEGINSRMDGIQAAVLTVKMRYLARWTDRRVEIAAVYNEGLKRSEQLSTPHCESWAKHVYHLYVIKTDKRNDLMARLDQAGISTAVQYPVCLPLLRAYGYLNPNRAAFENARRNQDRILSLPMFPELSRESQEYIMHEIWKFLE